MPAAIPAASQRRWSPVRRHNQPGQQRPRGQAERRRADQVPGAGDNRRNRDHRGGQHLRRAAAAELTRRQRRQHHQRAGDQRGRQPQASRCCRPASTTSPTR